MKTVDVRTATAWRAWLAANHRSESEVWLIFQKRHTGRACVGYEDAVNEALCFGWVDSLIKRVDDDRYARKFTPRKPGSKWSSINRRRYAGLVEAGRVTSAGRDRPPARRSTDAPRPSVTRLPAYIRQALRAAPKARACFEALAPSHKRSYIAWIDSAKRRETKQRRLSRAVAMLAAGKALGLK